MLSRALSIILVAILLAGTAVATNAKTALPSRTAASGTPYLLVFVIDGFRPDYETLARMAHVHTLMARGMTYDTAWVGQMESETPTGHATIGTGVYPRKHSVVGFGWRDVGAGQFTFMPTDLRQINSGQLTHVIEQGGVPTVSDLIHQRNRKDLTVALSGEKYYAAATMGAGADYVLYGKDVNDVFRPTVIGSNVPPKSSGYAGIKGDSSFSNQDAFVASLGIQMLRTMRPRALLLNLPDSDIAGHYLGGMADPKEMAPIIRAVDFAVGRVVAEYARLGLLNNTVVVLTADHGMASNRHIVPIHPIYKAVAQTGYPTLDEELRITVGSIWMQDPSHAAAVAGALEKQRFNGVEGALYKTASGTSYAAGSLTAGRLGKSLLKAYLDLADTEASPAGPEVILPYVEDATGLTVKGRKLWGNHGGFSWGVQHIPLVIAGPGVKHGVSHFPAKLVDIAPTMERLIGLQPPRGVDGVVLADAMKSPTTDERSAEDALRASRLADVNALRAHSVAQSKGH